MAHAAPARPRPRPGPDADIMAERLPTTVAGFLLALVRARPALHAGLVATIVLATSCAVGVQYSVKLLVDAMSAAEAHRLVWLSLGLFLALIFTENVLWRVSGWLGCHTVVADCVRVRLMLFAHLSGHSARFFNQNLTGALGSRIAATTASLQQILRFFIFNIGPPTVDFMGAMVVMLVVDWRLAVALAVGVTLVATGLIAACVRGRGVHQVFAERAAVTGGELVDTVANIAVVRAFAAGRREFQRLAGNLDTEARAERRSWLMLEKVRVGHDLALWVIAGGMLAWTLLLWSRGQITPGDVVMVSALTFRILNGSRDLSLALASSSQYLGSIGETLRVISKPHDVSDSSGARPLAARAASITFEKVTFGYRPDRPVFRNLDLRIPAGQSVGVVGASGAGKSTLVSLLHRQADVQGGRILVDGRDIREITQDSLRANIAIVQQEVALFHRSVLDNIRYGRPQASEIETVAAAKAARCHEFILSLPEGYQTMVGERGVRLSGGQRQRLAIARAILKDAPIVLLDEATSALDSETERAIQEAFAALTRGRTVLAVAHRLSTIARYDRILVVEEGVVIEDGSFDELRRAGGAFEAMWRLQADAFDEGGLDGGSDPGEEPEPDMAEPLLRRAG